MKDIEISNRGTINLFYLFLISIALGCNNKTDSEETFLIYFDIMLEDEKKGFPDFEITSFENHIQLCLEMGSVHESFMNARNLMRDSGNIAPYYKTLCEVNRKSMQLINLLEAYQNREKELAEVLNHHHGIQYSDVMNQAFEVISACGYSSEIVHHFHIILKTGKTDKFIEFYNEQVDNGFVDEVDELEKDIIYKKVIDISKSDHQIIKTRDSLFPE